MTLGGISWETFICSPRSNPKQCSFPGVSPKKGQETVSHTQMGFSLMMTMGWQGSAGGQGWTEGRRHVMCWKDAWTGNQEAELCFLSATSHPVTLSKTLRRSDFMTFYVWNKEPGRWELGGLSWATPGDKAGLG